VTERELERQRLRTEELDQRLYYDYESRFIKQRLERDQMRLLPRVVKPPMFAPGGHALGDVRVFERFTVGPVSMLTCRFLTLGPGEATPRERRLPSLTVFVLEGGGTCVQDGAEHAFTAGDVVFVPPYTTCSLVAGPSGLRAWIPEVRLWHVLGLLWHEHFEPRGMPAEVESRDDEAGGWSGYRIPRGVLGLERDLRVRSGADPRREAVFAARRAAPDAASFGDTRYDQFLRMLASERELHEQTPRVVRGAEQPWEDTRQGRLRYYLTAWLSIAGQDLELASYQIAPGHRSGRHRHVAEELLLVVEGSGHDLHDGSEHAWEAGDLICVPAMTEHQHVNHGDGPATLVSVWTHHPTNEFLGGVEHLEDASSWSQQ
jgi:quercetin dioxygenase-like cupin family protein